MRMLSGPERGLELANGILSRIFKADVTQIMQDDMDIQLFPGDSRKKSSQRIHIEWTKVTEQDSLRSEQRFHTVIDVSHEEMGHPMVRGLGTHDHTWTPPQSFQNVAGRLKICTKCNAVEWVK